MFMQSSSEIREIVDAGVSGEAAVRCAVLDGAG